MWIARAYVTSVVLTVSLGFACLQTTIWRGAGIRAQRMIELGGSRAAMALWMRELGFPGQVSRIGDVLFVVFLIGSLAMTGHLWMTFPETALVPASR